MGHQSYCQHIKQWNMKNNNFLESVKYFGLRKLFWILKRTTDSLINTLMDLEIINPSSHQSILKRRISRFLINQYDGYQGHNINTDQYFLGFGLLHYAYIRNLRPEHILCVGSRQGYIPAILALACKDNNFGHVDFVDAGYDDDQPSTYWGGEGFWKKNDPVKHFAQLGISKYLSTFVMTTVEYAKYYPGKNYQYIYIDGDHSLEGVGLDYSLFWPRLEKRGFMSFHDVVARGHVGTAEYGVWQFWKKIKKMHTIIFPFPRDSGLGLIQK